MLNKFYSLDECKDHDKVLNYLETLQTDVKIYFSYIDKDIFRIKDTGLLPKELNHLLAFFDDNDVLPYLDFPDDEDEYSDEDDNNTDDYDDDYL